MMDLPNKLKDEIWDYCRINNISNIDEFKLKLITQGFTVEKYGATPSPKEKIVEKIVEVQIEKIVEKIIEVPVQMIDTELSDNLKKYIDLYEKSQVEMFKILNISETLKKELEEEKIKNKKDLYGE